MWWSITLGLLVLAWIVRDYRRNRLEVRVFKPQEPSEIRTTEAINKQLAAGTFSLDSGIKIGREEQYREQFSEVAMLLASADGYPASKLAMQEVLNRYPAFAESARHLQIIGESLDIIEKTKSLKTLESRAEVVRTNQAAMFDALPFPIDADTRATQEGRIDEILKDGIARLGQTQAQQPKVMAPAAPAQAWQTTVNKGFSEIDRLIAQGDWDSARAALQHIAYGMVDAEPEAKAEFTSTMSRFAERDPLFANVLQAALPAIEQTPGIKQADLYRGMAEDQKELIRYVLYFAAELGRIVRVKSGNSYALYPAGFVPPAKPSKPRVKKAIQP